VTDAGQTSGGDGGDGGQFVVLGGYGAVGRVVAESLGEWFPGRVVVAGRDLGRATAVAEASRAGLIARAVDVGDPDAVGRAIADARVVVMCVERANEAVARACLERGVHIVDISASAPVLEAIARLDDLATTQNATAALSVGVAPGLTNLLARHCVDRLPGARRLDITVLIGLGERHGTAAVQWTVDGLVAPHRRDTRVARPGRARVSLPGFGTRTAYPFPFSDQHTLTETLGVPTVTRLCFDSALLTNLVFGLQATRAMALVGRLGAKGALTWLFSRVHLGSDRFVVHAAASDGDRTVACATTGRQEARVTGIIAAHVARQLASGAAPGARHLDQLVHPEQFLEELRLPLQTYLRAT
jgi:saccharopine dehydrogenase-like protein